MGVCTLLKKYLQEAINFISKGINKNMIVEYSPLLDEAIENFKDYGVLRFIGSKVFVLQCASDFFSTNSNVRCNYTRYYNFISPSKC